MFTRLMVFPWAGGRAQAMAIAEAIPNAWMILRNGSAYRYRQGDLVVNWGSSVRPPWMVHGIRLLNQPERCGIGKTNQYELFKAADIPTLTYTRDHNEALRWNRKQKVVARTQEHGMGGHGVRVYQPGTLEARSLFYTKYYKKEREFRFHVFNGKIIFVQEKKKVTGEQSDPYIRSHGRGWCFAFHHLAANPPPEGLDQISISAVRAARLDFGAVDIGWNNRHGGVVFEVNTAPGIENTSLQAYVKTFRSL